DDAPFGIERHDVAGVVDLEGRMGHGAHGSLSFMNDTPRIKGVLSPVVTPFKPDLSPDPERFVRQCRWLLSQNVGLAVFGTNSEANSLSVDEKIELLDRLVGAGIDPSRMMPGTGHCALPDSVRMTAHAVKLGCAGVLMLPPFYYKGVSDDGLYRSFAEIIERVGQARRRRRVHQRDREREPGSDRASLRHVAGNGRRRAARAPRRDPRDLREVPDDPGAEVRDRSLRRRCDVGHRAAAARRAHAGAD